MQLLDHANMTPSPFLSEQLEDIFEPTCGSIQLVSFSHTNCIEDFYM